MAPTPITATHRVIANYTVGGLAHKIQMYANAAASLDPSGFDLVGRGGIGDPGFSIISDALFTVLAPFFTAADVVFVGCTLEQRVGTAYVPLVSVATTITPSVGGFFQPATGFDVTGKTTDNKVIHFDIYEGPFGIGAKLTAYSTSSANVKGLLDYLYAIGRAPVPGDGWNWRRSRGATFPQRWLAGIIDSNEKLRRIRGIK